MRPEPVGMKNLSHSISLIVLHLLSLTLFVGGLSDEVMLRVAFIFVFMVIASLGVLYWRRSKQDKRRELCGVYFQVWGVTLLPEAIVVVIHLSSGDGLQIAMVVVWFLTYMINPLVLPSVLNRFRPWAR